MYKADYLWKKLYLRFIWGSISQVFCWSLTLCVRNNKGLPYFVEGIVHSPCLGRILGIIGRDPSVSKSNQLRVDILQFFPYQIGMYSIDSSKTVGKFPEVLNFNRLLLQNRTHSSAPVRPVHCKLGPDSSSKIMTGLNCFATAGPQGLTSHS